MIRALQGKSINARYCTFLYVSQYHRRDFKGARRVRRLYHRVLIIRVVLSGALDVDREERFHSRHLSGCPAPSRGRTPARGTCERFVYFDEFRARQDRMSPLRRPERRNQLSLVLCLPRHSSPLRPPVRPYLSHPSYRGAERIVTNANSVSYALFFFVLYRGASCGYAPGGDRVNNEIGGEEGLLA